MKVGFAHLGRESLGIEYLSAVLKQAGHSTFLALDPGLFGENDNALYIPMLGRIFDQRKKVLEKVREEQPDVVGFSAYTNTYRWCIDMAREIRKLSDARIVIGGIHATLVPDVIIREDCIDYVVAGEAEQAMVDLVNRLEASEPTHNIPNVWTRRNGEILKNDPRPPIADLDSLPLPDKELFAEEINYEDDYLLLCSRGCIFNCTYCCESFINELYGNRFFRRRSVDSVMEELKIMKRRYRFRAVMFNDAILFTDKKWLRELLTRYKSEIGVPFRCFGQVRFLDEEMGELIKWAGCYAIEFGVQTMNERIRKNILNRRESNEHNARAFAVCDKLGLNYDIDHIFGLPEETEADHVLAAKFYSRLKKLNRLKCHNLVCFPRTKIARIAQEKGILSQDDQNRMEQGCTGDFFHVDEIRDEGERRLKRSFDVLFKLLPLLGKGTTRWLLKKRRYLWLHRTPRPLVLIGQVLLAIRKRDYRYILYLKYYWLRLSNATLRSWLATLRSSVLRSSAAAKDETLRSTRRRSIGRKERYRA